MKKAKVNPAFRWAGVINLTELDLEPHEAGYGRLYKTRKEARQFYTRVARVMVKVLHSSSTGAK